MTAPVSQSTLDALADAETLRANCQQQPHGLWISGWRRGAINRTCAGLLACVAHGLAPIIVRQAARAAFRAVPGLREP